MDGSILCALLNCCIFDTVLNFIVNEKLAATDVLLFQ